MPDYVPLELSAWCNAGLEILDPAHIGQRTTKSNLVDWILAEWKGSAPPAAPPIGEQQFHGLPFLIGSPGQGDGAKCFVALDGAAAPVRIPIQQRARYVILAHRLLDTEYAESGALLEGGTPARHVADYAFTLASGRRVVVPIREQFEIAAPRAFGKPYHVVADQKDSLRPRHGGPWGQAGRRQTEVIHGMPRAYYLWVWANPAPEEIVDGLEVLPAGPRFFIAGLTLGQRDEYPLVRHGSQPVRLTFKNESLAAQPFALGVDVDRGVAAYPYPLPTGPVDAFLTDALAGWGEVPNLTSSPAYVSVAAIPSATVTIRQGDVALDQFVWGELEQNGAVERPNVRIELLDRGRNWVHVTVLDDCTGKPVPCRVHFRSPEGVPYQPHGHHNHINSDMGTWHVDVGGDLRLGQATYAYIDGTCQGWLPRGEVIVDVARGFEYEPVRLRTTIAPGQQALTLRLKRWIHMNARRWFSGDAHVHFLSTQGAHRESQGEDLNVVNLLLSQWGSLFSYTEEFTGAPSVVSAWNNIVHASQENRQHMLGHLLLWGLKKPIMPWCSDGPNEAELGGTLETNLSDWADQCHQQGGTVVLPHFPIPNGEPAALIATGRADAVEMNELSASSHHEYYRYLNCGYRLPLVSGTDKMTSDVPVGLYRTYVHIPDAEQFSYVSWCRNVAQGRTFISSGPMLTFEVDGRGIGEVLQLSGPGTVEVLATAESIFPIQSLQIVQGGKVVASTEAPRQTRRLELRTKLKVESHTWLAARCGGPHYDDGLQHWDAWRRGIFAHTSPIYVACGGDWWLFDEQVARYMLTLVQGSLTYIRGVAAHAHAGPVTHHHGEADHQAFLERPLAQALHRLERRLATGGHML